MTKTKTKNPEQIATELEKENAVTNKGQGSNTVLHMITFLRRNQPDTARIVWDTDRDKIRQYEKLYKLCLKLGYEE